jgi:hypothetical protein
MAEADVQAVTKVHEKPMTPACLSQALFKVDARADGLKKLLSESSIARPTRYMTGTGAWISDPGWMPTTSSAAMAGSKNSFA